MLRIPADLAALQPDPVRLARYRNAPGSGPRVLFFSGGTALRSLSRALVGYTHNSIHIITPFDSGGSSAELRRAFRMPAVGDVRNRLMALADRSAHGNPAILELFAHRLPRDREPAALAGALDALVRGEDRLVRALPGALRETIREHLGWFRDRMPADFDLRGASIGNLVLAGGYLANNRRMDPVIRLFSRLAGVRGAVRPVVARDLHLCADLADGRTVLGQHNLTGKEAAPLTSPIRSLRLCRSLDDPAPAEASIGDAVRGLIREADLVCFPIGSFYTSVLATLLPGGVGEAVAANPCPKVFVPNPGQDPEMVGLSLPGAVESLLSVLQASCPGGASRESLLNFVLLDSRRGAYPGPLDMDRIRRLGVEVLDLPLLTGESAPLVDGELLAQALLTLA
ncbi:MAG: GAK system CofD-like protein [Thermodesulfobacteriota bacterium]